MTPEGTTVSIAVILGISADLEKSKDKLQPRIGQFRPLRKSNLPSSHAKP
jgi:penicillin V acylase-like amidase (Ntn superfamily)